MFAKSPLFIKIKLKDFKVQNFKFNYKILIKKPPSSKISLV